MVEALRQAFEQRETKTSEHCNAKLQQQAEEYERRAAGALKRSQQAEQSWDEKREDYARKIDKYACENCRYELRNRTGLRT
jgi:hypothetical protein